MSRRRPPAPATSTPRITNRPVSSTELELWQRLVADVEPIGARPRPKATVSPSPPSPEGRLAGPSERVPTSTPKAACQPPAGPVTLDRRIRHKLQRGQVPIAARLDLHGMTQVRAHAALIGFIQRQSILGARCVLVITGVGSRTGGILRSLTPRWLAEPPLAPLVLAISPASLKHGGDGAIYVMLRRRREGQGNAL